MLILKRFKGGPVQAFLGGASLEIQFLTIMLSTSEYQIPETSAFVLLLSQISLNHAYLTSYYKVLDMLVNYYQHQVNTLMAIFTI